MTERRLVVLLTIIAVFLVFIGWWLWVEAGTDHFESRVPSSSTLHSQGGDEDGPNRLPAVLAWISAGGAALSAIGLHHSQR